VGAGHQARHPVQPAWIELLANAARTLTRWGEHEHGGDRKLAGDRPQQVAVAEHPD
jgi:hypothetical protein